MSEEEEKLLFPKRSRPVRFDSVTKEIIRPKTVDEVLEVVGGAGFYQYKLFLLMSILGIMGKDVIGIIFFAGDQDHWCYVPQLSHLNDGQQKDIAIPMDKYGEFSQCEMYALNYSSYTHEQFMEWNRSIEVNSSTPTQSCSQGWIYDQSLFTSTITSRACTIFTFSFTPLV